MEYVLYTFLGLVLFFVIRYISDRHSIRAEFKKKFPLIEKLFREKKYEEVLQLIHSEDAFLYRYRLTTEMKKQIMEIEALSYEHTGQIKQAIMSLGHNIAAAYTESSWPQNIVDNWVRLYCSHESMAVEDFYFCSGCGMNPTMVNLVKYAIEHGGPIPVGFEDYFSKNFPGIVIHFDK